MSCAFFFLLSQSSSNSSALMLRRGGRIGEESERVSAGLKKSRNRPRRERLVPVWALSWALKKKFPPSIGAGCKRCWEKRHKSSSSEQQKKIFYSKNSQLYGPRESRKSVILRRRVVSKQRRKTTWLRRMVNEWRKKKLYTNVQKSHFYLLAPFHLVARELSDSPLIFSFYFFDLPRNSVGERVELDASNIHKPLSRFW